MRILANFSHRNNGNSYSVSLEAFGDCPKDQVETTIDELFRMAKASVQRQVSSEIEIDDAPHKEYSDAPITPKQKSLIIKLARERGQFIDGLSQMNTASASQVIQDLLAVEV